MSNSNLIEGSNGCVLEPSNYHNLSNQILVQNVGDGHGEVVHVVSIGNAVVFLFIFKS